MLTAAIVVQLGAFTGFVHCSAFLVNRLVEVFEILLELAGVAVLGHLAHVTETYEMFQRHTKFHVNKNLARTIITQSHAG